MAGLQSLPAVQEGNFPAPRERDSLRSNGAGAGSVEGLEGGITENACYRGVSPAEVLSPRPMQPCVHPCRGGLGTQAMRCETRDGDASGIEGYNKGPALFCKGGERLREEG